MRTRARWRCCASCLNPSQAIPHHWTRRRASWHARIALADISLQMGRWDSNIISHKSASLRRACGRRSRPSGGRHLSSLACTAPTQPRAPSRLLAARAAPFASTHALRCTTNTSHALPAHTALHSTHGAHTPAARRDRATPVCAPSQ